MCCSQFPPRNCDLLAQVFLGVWLSPRQQLAGQYSLWKTLFNHPGVHAHFVRCRCQIVKHRRIDRMGPFWTILEPTILRYRNQIVVFLSFNVQTSSHAYSEQAEISNTILHWLTVSTYCCSERGRNWLGMEWEGMDIIFGKRKQSGEFWWAYRLCSGGWFRSYEELDAMEIQWNNRKDIYWIERPAVCSRLHTVMSSVSAFVFVCRGGVMDSECPFVGRACLYHVASIECLRALNTWFSSWTIGPHGPKTLVLTMASDST